MLSPYAVVAFFTLLILMTRWSVIADAYDEEQRKVNWDHCQNAGTFREVMTWWWRR